LATNTTAFKMNLKSHMARPIFWLITFSKTTVTFPIPKLVLSYVVHAQIATRLEMIGSRLVKIAFPSFTDVQLILVSVV